MVGFWLFDWFANLFGWGKPKEEKPKEYVPPEEVKRRIEEAVAKAELEVAKKELKPVDKESLEMQARGLTAPPTKYEKQQERVEAQVEFAKETQHKTATVVSGGSVTFREIGPPKIETKKIEKPTETVIITTETRPVREITITQEKPTTKVEELTQKLEQTMPAHEKFLIGTGAGAVVAGVSMIMPLVGFGLSAIGAWQLGTMIGKDIKEGTGKTIEMLKQPETIGFIVGSLVFGGFLAASRPARIEIIQPPREKEIVRPLIGYEEIKHFVHMKEFLEKGIEEKILFWEKHGWVYGKYEFISKESLPKLLAEGQGKVIIKTFEIHPTRTIESFPTGTKTEIIAYKMIYDPVKSSLSQATQETIKPFFYETVKPAPLITKEGGAQVPFLIPFTSTPQLKTYQKIEEKQYAETKISQQILQKPQLKITSEEGSKPNIRETFTETQKTFEHIDTRQTTGQIITQIQKHETPQITTTTTTTTTTTITEITSPPTITNPPKLPTLLWLPKIPKFEKLKEKEAVKPPRIKISPYFKYKPSLYAVHYKIKLGKMPNIAKEIKKALIRPII
jgi:hypothetical protein